MKKKWNTVFMVIMCLLLLSMGCRLDNSRDDISPGELEQPDEAITEKYPVSFSAGSHPGGQQRTLSRVDVKIPEEYQFIGYIMLTIKDSLGRIVVNRSRTKKINWAPGFVYSEPIELSAGSYTLEEFVLLDYGDDVLYATPRQTNFFSGEDTVLAQFVDNPLPLAFQVTGDRNNAVYTQVIDVNAEVDFMEDPGKFFGYDLGILAEVDVFIMEFSIIPISGSGIIDGVMTVTCGEQQVTEEVTGVINRICLPRLPGYYTIRITNADGAIYENGNLRYEDFVSSGFNMNLELYHEISAVFMVQDGIGNDIDVTATLHVNTKTYPADSWQTENVPIRNDGSPVEFILKTDTLNFFRIIEPGFQIYSGTFPVSELRGSTTTPILVNLNPNTVTFPLVLKKSDGISFDFADVEVRSAGQIYAFNGLALDQTHTMNISRVADYITIEVMNDDLFPALIENKYMHLNNSGTNDPVTIVLFPDTAPIIDDFENSESLWIPNTGFEKKYGSYSGYFMAIDYYYENTQATLTTKYAIDFNKNSNLVLTFYNDIFKEFATAVLQQYHNEAWEDVMLIPLHDRGLYYPVYQELNLNHLTGMKKLRILVDMNRNFANSQSGIDEIRLISKEYSDVQFQVALSSSDQVTEGEMVIRGIPDLAMHLVDDINNVSFMPQGNIIEINFQNAYGSVTCEYDPDFLRDLTEPLVIIMPEIPPPPPVPVMEEGFEVNLGVWTQATDDDFNWTRHSSSTPSADTGPSTAWEGSYYLYTESSGSNFPAKTASIISPYYNFDTQTGEYINLKLSMYGEGMGTFSVSYQNMGSDTWNLIDRVSGDQGSGWFDFNNSLSGISGIARIKITGVTGSDYTSDMAIDSIRMNYPQ